MKRVAILLSLGVFLAVSCEKREQDNSDDNVTFGTYYGTFTVEYFVDMREGWSSNGQVTLELKDGKYTYTSDIPPKLCSGKYSISNDKILFEYNNGQSYPDLNIVPPYFDVGLIPNGEYGFTFDGNRLIFSATKDYLGHYEYNLEKQ
jgi:hypothetical protein